MLKPYRVLDLTDARAELGPMILADLGADVIKVEPPGGTPSRWSAPLDAGAPDGLASLRFHAFNRGKRSITCDLESDAGRGRFLELVAGADFVIENAPPGAMADRGIGWEALRAVNPMLVHVAITPFGQDGPYAAHASSDLTLAAMGGMMAVTGDADRPPVRVTVPQTWRHAAAESAVAALVAHHRRLQTGQGQFVDVSVQACVFWTTMNAMIAAAVQGHDIERAATLVQLGIVDLVVVYDAIDGQVVLVPTGGTMARLVERCVAEGICGPEWLTEEDWPTYDLRFLSSQPVRFTPAESQDVIRRFTARHGKRELFEWGLRENVTIVPVSTIEDVLRLDHLEQRRYWQPYSLPSGKGVRLPGPFVRFSGAPIPAGPAAPGIGQDNDAVLGIPRSPASASPPSSAGDSDAGGGLPFAGLRIADFSWIGVGPITAKYFADHGATVVRVEAVNPADRLRHLAPLAPRGTAPNRSQFFGGFNTSKKSLAVDLKAPEGQAVAKKLLAWADVVFESFTPGTMADLGLGYEAARELNPGIIMASTCLMGQTGPAASLAGYGYHAAAISGFYEITGWPDRNPGGPYQAYTDVVVPRFLATAVAAALDHRRRTGEGQYIEQAQIESALHFLAPELLDYQVNGTVPGRAGNDSPLFAPHNAYPCRGDDQWIAIAVETDEQWAALVGALGRPGWALDERYASADGRLADRRKIDGALGAATGSRDRYELMAELQAAGVPAGVVQRSSDLLRDPQFAHRHFYRPMVHPEMGEVPYEGHQFRIDGYDSGPRSPAPCLGEHTVEVLVDLLGVGDEELMALLGSGAVGV